MSFTPPMFGTIESRSAVGLPTGLNFNVATGEVSGTPVGGSSADVTITLTGRGVTTTKVFKVQVVDLDAYAYKVDVTPTGYAGSETLRDFPALIRLSVAGVLDFPIIVSSLRIWTVRARAMICVPLCKWSDSALRNRELGS